MNGPLIATIRLISVIVSGVARALQPTPSPLPAVITARN